VAVGFEIEAETFGQVEFIFDDEDSAHWRPDGISNVNVLPRSEPSLSAQARPP
jgi:hypothetical protein